MFNLSNLPISLSGVRCPTERWRQVGEAEKACHRHVRHARFLEGRRRHVRGRQEGEARHPIRRKVHRIGPRARQGHGKDGFDAENVGAKTLKAIGHIVVSRRLSNFPRRRLVSYSFSLFLSSSTSGQIPREGTSFTTPFRWSTSPIW